MKSLLTLALSLGVFFLSILAGMLLRSFSLPNAADIICLTLMGAIATISGFTGIVSYCNLTTTA
ncbi:MAG: hypothetical protein EOP51_10515 [Sphingobacteriales bacterium]|nr:MAG: hypothetical protein EOP51_10515 [Sphingobacteriales bacterium]